MGRYDLTIVARNDACPLAPYPLPPGLWSAEARDLWLTAVCAAASTCRVAGGAAALPPGCHASGRGCFSQAGGHNYQPHRRWLGMPAPALLRPAGPSERWRLTPERRLSSLEARRGLSSPPRLAHKRDINP